MALTYDEFIANLQKGEVKAAGGSGDNAYQDAVFTIEKAAFIPCNKLPEKLAAKMDVNGVYWGFKLTFEFADGAKKQHAMFDSALTKKGDIACYPSDDAIGLTGKLLHDIAHGIKEFDARSLPKGWLNDIAKLPELLTGKQGIMQAKLVKDGEYLIALTSYQKKKDAAYVPTPSADVYASPAAVTEPQAAGMSIDPDDLPF